MNQGVINVILYNFDYFTAIVFVAIVLLFKLQTFVHLLTLNDL